MLKIILPAVRINASVHTFPVLFVVFHHVYQIEPTPLYTHYMICWPLPDLFTHQSHTKLRGVALLPAGGRVDNLNFKIVLPQTLPPDRRAGCSDVGLYNTKINTNTRHCQQLTDLNHKKMGWWKTNITPHQEVDN